MSNAGDKAGAMELDPTWAPSNLDPWILETGPKATIPELLISDIPLLGFSLCVSHNFGRYTPALVKYQNIYKY